MKVLAKGRLVRDPCDGRVFYVTILDVATDLLLDQAANQKIRISKADSGY